MERATWKHQFEDIQEEQGWTDDTLLELLLDFIGSNDLNDSAREYLEYCAEEENGQVES